MPQTIKAYDGTPMPVMSVVGDHDISIAAGAAEDDTATIPSGATIAVVTTGDLAITIDDGTLTYSIPANSQLFINCTGQTSWDLTEATEAGTTGHILFGSI